MNIAIALVLGLLIGWPVEWVIDWFCWQRPQQEIVALPASKPVPTQKVRYKTRPADADDLKKVNGIGPVIKKRLNKAGIYKYEQVAELTLDEFDEALEKVAQRFISSRAIISHSQELADQNSRGHRNERAPADKIRAGLRPLQIDRSRHPDGNPDHPSVARAGSPSCKQLSPH